MQLTAELFSNTAFTRSIHLIPKSENHSLWIVVGLIFCIVLVSLARIRQREVFLVLARGSFTFKSMNEQHEDGIRENPFTLLLLTTQYFIISGLVIYWSDESLFSNLLSQNTLLILTPITLLIYQLLVISVIGAITGRSEIISEVVLLSLNLAQTCGIFLLTFFLFIYFQPEYSNLAKWLIASTFIFFFTLRFIRGFVHAIQQDIPWYYIILYLWTLEILPILIVVKLVFKGEIDSWFV